MSTVIHILRMSVWVFAYIMAVVLVIFIPTLTLCVTFPTRGITQLWGSEWGLLTIPLALFLDSLIITSVVVYVSRNKAKLPDWLRGV